MLNFEDRETVARRATEVINVLDGLTVGDAQIVLKQAEAVILGAQRVIANLIMPDDVLAVVSASFD